MDIVRECVDFPAVVSTLPSRRRFVDLLGHCKYKLTEFEIAAATSILNADEIELVAYELSQPETQMWISNTSTRLHNMSLLAAIIFPQ